MGPTEPVTPGRGATDREPGDRELSDPTVVVAGELVRSSTRVVALTGAGISTGSGIPDFRGPNGLWTKDPAAEKRATIDVYLSDRDLRVATWASRAAGHGAAREPNAGHAALVDLERQGRLHTLITQNIDSLHHAAGSDPDRIVEVHGHTREVTCLSCGERAPMERALDRVRAGEEDPPCRSCGGILKAATISFGQGLVAADLERAFLAAAEADLVLAVGTTLAVYPVAETVPIALRAGTPVIIVNAEPTPFDDAAAVVVRGDISVVLPAIVAHSAQEH
jgi:NAD-dependent deacetylase